MTFKKLIAIVLLITPLAAQAKTLMVLGDSLSAGYGIDVSKGWVQLLRTQLLPGNHKVINASVSGETTAGALARLPALLELHKPEILIVELGGNDGLRGHPVKLIRRNLNAISAFAQKNGAQVLLLGIQIPPNYGARYANQFARVFSSVAEQLDIPLVPFFLHNVILKEGWMQPDGIHPKAIAQAQLLDNVMPYLTPML